MYIVYGVFFLIVFGLFMFSIGIIIDMFGVCIIYIIVFIFILCFVCLFFSLLKYYKIE